MRKNSDSRSAFANPRIFVAFLLCFSGAALAVFGWSASAQDPPARKSTRTSSATPATASPATQHHNPLSRTSVPDPILAVKRLLFSYGISGLPKRPFARTAAAGSHAATGSPSNQSLMPFVSEAVSPVLSVPLRDLPAANQFSAWIEQPEPRTPLSRLPQLPRNPQESDSVLQPDAPAAMPTPGVTFEGMAVGDSCQSCLPPDPVGAVGPNHYVQMVNSHLAIYNKSGAVVTPAKAINSLWASVPGTLCATHNNGDPIVLYDQLADRWLVSQFTVQETTENYAECIAISQTPDPSGAYYLYEFDQGPDVFNDYPKIGLWPDGYYMSTNQFPNDATADTAAGAWAFERPKMLLGQPARFVFFDETPLITTTYTPFGQLPASVDGHNPPPAGAPNYFAEVTDANQPNTPPATGLHDEMRIWKFHVDWTDPTRSTFGTGSTAPSLNPGITGQYAGLAGQPDFLLPIADYIASACQIENGPNDCSPEKLNPPQAPQYLDVLGDRLMFRLVYRNFGDHESLILNHTADTPPDPSTGVARNGVRWYEVRGLSSTAVVFQQGTFAPLQDPANPLWRWMGSAAMDGNGNLAIGYTASGPTLFPSLYYAGRLAADPLGELSQGEAVLFAGLGNEVQVGVFPFRNRWGDYSALTIDPTDDCTFWYTNEYIAANTAVLGASWRTRIGNFKFPTCGSQASPTPTATATATASPTPTATATASPTATATATASPTPTATATASPTATATATASPTATATATASPTPTATATTSPSATATATGTPTPTPTPSASPTPSPSPAQLLNISTRGPVLTGDNALIAGFIVTGNVPKRVIVRAIGPSLQVPGKMEDPTLELRDSNGALVMFNDDWKDSQRAAIQNSGLAPTDDRESAILRTVDPGSYTAILRGSDNTTGIAVVEAYDLDVPAASQMANISTRGRVQVGDNVLIGGFIGGPNDRSSASMVIRALGPSLSAFGVPGALQNPILELHNQNGATIASNDDWGDNPDASKIQAAGLAPKDSHESALYLTASPAGYTAIVRGKDDTTGVGLVEVYNVK
jgi:hypothetical protein